MAWRVAKSLLQLKAQIDALYPGRDKSADGTIGDAAHSSRTSDHNPNPRGVVCAMDITHDPARGLNAGIMADNLRTSGDQRIKYIISNRRIANSGGPWRKYSGKNPHDHHFHVSVHGDYDSEARWNIGRIIPDIVSVPKITPKPAIKPAKAFLVRGSRGPDVERLQQLLSIEVDGEFGPQTERAVKAFQKKRQMVADGKVGLYTWTALEA